MPMAIGYMTLCPFLELSLHIYQDNYDQVVLNYNTESVSGLKEIGNRDGKNAGYYAPEVNAGFTLEMPDLDGGTWIPGVSYNLFLPLYRNSYDVYGITGTVNGAASWETTFEGDKIETISVTTREISDMYHRLTPSLSYVRSFIERLQLGFSAKLPVSFGYRVEKTLIEEKRDTSTPSTISRSDTTITRITALPELALGAAFQAVPGTLNLQTGFSLTIGYEGVWGKTDPGGTGEKTQTTHDLSPLKGRVSAGFSLNFDSGFSLDAVFSSGGDFSLTASEFSILFAVKK
jgi:hypothetical protein